MTSSRRAMIGIAIAALLLGVGALVAVINGQHNIHRGAYAALALGIGWGFTCTGLYSWTRRPASNIGPLMIAVGFAGLLKALAFSGDSVIFTIGSISELLIYALLIHLLLSFPSGRLESGVDRLLVGVAYFNATVVQLAAFVLNNPAKAGCPHCPANPLLIDHSQAAAGVINAAQLNIAVAVLGAVVAVLYRHWRDSTMSQRRGLAPVLAVGSLTFGLLMTELIVEQASLSSTVADGLTLALFSSLACLPVAFLVGLVRYRFSQAEAISSLVGRLGGNAGRVSLRDALAEALGDPTLELAYWVPNQDAYVDADGHAMRIDPPPKGKIATTVENKGMRVGAIVHDADLADERDLVRAVGAAAALTLENERLDAELRARVDELHTSRARIVTAGYAERRRLERDLHDGAQQRLMALGINLRLARDLIATDAEAATLLDASLAELNEATRELRELARGIHPAVLTERGLHTALNGLALRSPVPVELVETPDEQLPSSVESAVYFVVAEALTNVARYAQARTVTVTVVRRNGQVDVQVSDDGVGGADPAQGSGLRGLSDRVAALDGPPRSDEPERRWHDRDRDDPVRVIVADDSVLLREGVTRMLEKAGFEVVGHAADQEDLMRKARAHKPDVAIIDIRMPPTHTDEGLQAARAIREEMPGTGVVVLSAYIEAAYALELLADDPAGVGYLLKDRVWDGDRFAEAVRRVAEGGSALDPEVVSHMLGRRRVHAPLEELTPREHDVLGLMAEGRSNQAIADALVISGRAVEKHVSSIFTKLNLPPAPEDHRRVLAVLAFLRS